MGGLFSIDGPLARFLGKFADLIILSLLWILCSLPILTMGAANTALYTMTLRMARGAEEKAAAGFFRAFRENLKKSTAVHLVLCGLLAMIVFYYLAVGSLPEGVRVIFYGAAFLFSLLWLMEAVFIYPVLARFENTIGNSMKNAWFMAAGNLPVFLFILGILGLPLWTALLNTMLFLKSFLFWVFAGPGLTAWLSSYLFCHIFRKYEPKEETEEKDEGV